VPRDVVDVALALAQQHRCDVVFALAGDSLDEVTNAKLVNFCRKDKERRDDRDTLAAPRSICHGAGQAEGGMHIERSRIRTSFGGKLIAGSERVLLVYGTKRPPAYWFPIADVRSVLKDELRQGAGTVCWRVVVSDRVAQNAARTYIKPFGDRAGAEGHLTFFWDQMDVWFEEDEEIFAVLAQNCRNIEKTPISSNRPHSLGWHGYDPVRSRLSPLVPFSKPSVTGARACRIATSGDRLAPATPSPISALSRQLAPVGFALPSAAADPRNFGTRQTGDCDQVAWQRLSDLPAMAIIGRPKTSDEIRDLIRQMSLDNPLWGAPRVHGELLKLGIEVSPPPLEGICLGARRLPPRLGAASCGTI